MRSAAIGIVAGALMMISAATASAQIVRACVNTVNGRITLLTDAGCGTKEALIEWNLGGLQGPPGPAGAQGPAGPQGAPGTNGAPGQIGLQGPAGTQGPQGPAGQQGPQGLEGTRGAQGLEGARGAQGSTGAQGDAGLDGALGPEGPQGPAGSQGPQGLQGADGRPAEQGGLLVVDAVGQHVGAVTDVYNGYVVRKEGDDMVWFAAPYSGLPVAPTIFFHVEADCGGERYLQTMGGQGLAYFAKVHRGVVFYTRTLDPWGAIAVPVHSYEVVGPTEDATRPGRQCFPYDGRTNSLGVVTTVFDPALASLMPPFRIK